MSDVLVLPRYTIGVLLHGAREAIVVAGRTGAMLAWLVQHRARVERVGRGTLIFNLGLSSFTPELRELFTDQAAVREPIPGEIVPVEGAA